jgi:prevent-host-death family protein
MPQPRKREKIVVSALRARTHFGKLLHRVETNQESLIIEKRGTPRAILLGIKEYVRLSAPEPEVLRLLGEESREQGTDKLSPQEIDTVIRRARAKKSKRQ